MSPAPQPRVVLLAGGPAHRAFVATALAPLAIDLVTCRSVLEARAALAVPADLLVCVPDTLGEPCTMLLAEQATRPLAARAIVFGGTAQPQASVAEPGAWRALPTPCDQTELADAVRAALQQVAAINEHFGGDQVLYAEYAAFCLAQFHHDIHAGDAALRAGDAGALRRAGHSLKTVLRTLGHPALADVAELLETSAHVGDVAQAAAPWQALAAGLRRLARGA